MFYIGDCVVKYTPIYWSNPLNIEIIQGCVNMFLVMAIRIVKNQELGLTLS